MRPSLHVTLAATALAASLTGSALAAAFNPTPNRESKLLVGFESETATGS